MKTVNKVIGTLVKIKIECPSCGEEVGEWSSDPRGDVDKCDSCGEKFKVASDAELVIKNW